jgi:hypothetical protein
VQSPQLKPQSQQKRKKNVALYNMNGINRVNNLNVVIFSFFGGEGAKY